MDVTGPDRDGGPTPSSTSIESSIGYLVLGLGVICFFFLTVMGMGRVDKLTTNAAQGMERVDAAPTAEIGGNNPAASAPQ